MGAGTVGPNRKRGLYFRYFGELFSKWWDLELGYTNEKKGTMENSTCKCLNLDDLYQFEK